MINNMITTGEELKTYRIIKLKMGIKKFGELVGISHPTILRIEKCGFIEDKYRTKINQIINELRLKDGNGN